MLTKHTPRMSKKESFISPLSRRRTTRLSCMVFACLAKLSSEKLTPAASRALVYVHLGGV